jgi:hypothetical protein
MPARYLFLDEVDAYPPSPADPGLGREKRRIIPHPNHKQESIMRNDRIEDRRGRPSGIPGGRGGLGIGTIVVLGLIGWAMSIDPRLVIGGAEVVSKHARPSKAA